MQRYEIISDYRLYTPDYFAEAEEIKSKIDIYQLCLHFHPHLYDYFFCTLLVPLVGHCIDFQQW